jgi:hypothetical protein
MEADLVAPNGRRVIGGAQSTDILAGSRDLIEDIYQSCARKIESFGLHKKRIRLIGVYVSNLVSSSGQRSLFEGKFPDLDRRENLREALDKIKDKFSEKAIKHRDF